MTTRGRCRPRRGRAAVPPWSAISRRSFGDIVRIALTLLILAGLGGVIVWQWPNMASLYRSARAPAPPTQVANDAQPTTTRSAKVTERFGQSGDTPTAQPQPALAAAPSGAAATAAAVAQKVVLYEEDPSDPNGQPFRRLGDLAHRAGVAGIGPAGRGGDPRRRRDSRPQADHDLVAAAEHRPVAAGEPHGRDHVPPAAGLPAGLVTNVPGILMKQTEQTRGAPLAGHAVKVTDSYYLIGLSSFDADRENNLRMLKERGWFDIPVVYSNKRRAILAVEKGTPGDRAFAEAFAAWRQ